MSEMSDPTKAIAAAAPVGPPTPPPSVRVGTVTYRVTDDPDEWIRKEHAEQDKSKLGRTEHREATIWLDPDAAPTVKRQTLWHEVMHALAGEFNGVFVPTGKYADKSPRELFHLLGQFAAECGDVQRQTLWHEVLHAAHWTVMGSPNWQGLGEDNDSREETVIKMWEHPTLAVLRDNPALVRYLMGDA